MVTNNSFPKLISWEPTLTTLRAYSNVLSVITRTYSVSHPEENPAVLNVYPDGLISNSMPLPNSGAFSLRMDLRKHAVMLKTNHPGLEEKFVLREGLSVSAFANNMLEFIAKLGLEISNDPKDFQDNSPRPDYDSDIAEKFFLAVLNGHRVLTQHRANIGGRSSTVQLWLSNLNLVFEWLGRRPLENRQNEQSYLRYLIFGFSPGDSHRSVPYFYVRSRIHNNEKLQKTPLPQPTHLETQYYEETLLEYEGLVDDNHSAEKLLTNLNSVI